mmetsp:Transcript_44951/g.70475  ORF Transcript_44951/g.70475 Transcript_44951/m.70475 type:complete len:216 (-) Transcript_44951:108-755(-)
MGDSQVLATRGGDGAEGSGTQLRNSSVTHWVNSEEDLRGHAADRRGEGPADEELRAQDTLEGEEELERTEGAERAGGQEIMSPKTDVAVAPRNNPWSPMVRPIKLAFDGFSKAGKEMGTKLADVWDMHDLADDLKEQRDRMRRTMQMPVTPKSENSSETKVLSEKDDSEATDSTPSKLAFRTPSDDAVSPNASQPVRSEEVPLDGSSALVKRFTL